ncbi:glycosyltransferase family 39 protein [Halorubrum coriense]|uniref:glycosyltransferase family 39 protein n=1 Tax=Halorubrum coriense TaxID=64713 RepID=UPI001268F3FB|nr:glycosyltransferase family 39 protein [Halorubrum coriense]
MNKTTTEGFWLFITGLSIRLIAAIITTVTTVNPDSTTDALEFGDRAETIAQGILEGNPYLYTTGSIEISQFLFPLASPDIYDLWGSFLAPFWLLPGPSGFYARLGNALFGALAIYNVYLIARYYHSHQAGVIAVLPMIFYPSFVAVHSTLLREAIVLFGITTAVRLLVFSRYRRSKWPSYALAAGLLHLSLLLRGDNFVIYAAAISAVILVYLFKSGLVTILTAGFGVALSPAAFALVLPTIRDGIEFLAYTRTIRARGRAVYLPEIVPRTILELVAFSWVGAAYFLYAPFPWMIETIPDLLVGTEGLVNIVFSIAAVWGVRSLDQKYQYAIVGLLVGLAVAIVLYGVGTVNYGTGMRHRQMFIWVIFLFGGVGICEHVRFVWPLRYGKTGSNSSDTRSVQSKSD